MSAPYHWNWDHWAWPQWSMLVMFALSLVFHAALNGQERPPRTYNFALRLCDVALAIWVFWAGGFFA